MCKKMTKYFGICDVITCSVSFVMKRVSISAKSRKQGHVEKSVVLLAKEATNIVLSTIKCNDSLAKQQFIFVMTSGDFLSPQAMKLAIAVRLYTNT